MKWMYNNSPIGGASQISDLLDVDNDTPADKDILIFNATSGKYEPHKVKTTLASCLASTDLDDVVGAGAFKELNSNVSKDFEQIISFQNTQTTHQINWKNYKEFLVILNLALNGPVVVTGYITASLLAVKSNIRVTFPGANPTYVDMGFNSDGTVTTSLTPGSYSNSGYSLWAK